MQPEIQRKEYNMKKTTVWFGARLCAGLIALLMLALCFASCASKGKALITLNKDGHKVSFSVNHYEFLLSRWKGYLVTNNVTNNGKNAEQDEFYDLKDIFNGTDLQTLDEYYSDTILDNGRNYTAVLWLFDSMDLSLSKDEMAAIDQTMDDILAAYGGSKTKLNALLANYGVNYNLLREMYIMEAKISAVQTALYGSEGSKLGTEVKDDFLSENYVRFKQIFIPYFNYVYKTDANGDEIYYLKESNMARIAYDEKNGYKSNDLDDNGDIIYYASSASKDHIAYNKDESVSTRSFVLDAEGSAKTTDMTTEERAAAKLRGEALYESLKNCTVEEFEAAIAKEDSNNGETVYTDGYYLQKNLDYATVSTEFAYFSDIISKTETMKAGEIVSITSDNAGYHIIMKYDPTPQAYTIAENEVWFKNFTSDLINKLFLEECKSLYSYMEINEKVLAQAPSIKELGVNTEF